MSISHQRSPCIAERGKAWWLWCQDSPIVGRASQNTFVDLSSVGKRRRPKKWQIELIEKVRWWTMNTRTRPAQKKRRERGGQGASHEPADRGRDDQPERHPEREVAGG